MPHHADQLKTFRQVENPVVCMCNTVLIFQDTEENDCCNYYLLFIKSGHKILPHAIINHIAVSVHLYICTYNINAHQLRALYYMWSLVHTDLFPGYPFPIHTVQHGDEGHLRHIPPEYPVLNVQQVEKPSAVLFSSQGQEAELWTFSSN